MRNGWQWVPVTDRNRHPALNLDEYRQLYVAYSGGLDSSVLLHMLANDANIRQRLIAVHIHHGISAHADAWQSHCQQACARHNIPLLVLRVELDTSHNLEEHARLARYAEFSKLLREGDALLLAHHQDDQAETLLLQLLRGSGIDGLAAMPASKKLGQGSLLRPLLGYAKQTLRQYAHAHQLLWVEDDSNQNQAHARNYLRQQIMPLLQQRWPAAAANIANSASHCQQALANLHTLASLDYPDIQQSVAAPDLNLSLLPLRKLSAARVTNVLRAWLKQSGIRMPTGHIIQRIVSEMIMTEAAQPSTIAWGQYAIKRYQQQIYLLTTGSRQAIHLLWQDFPKPLYVQAHACQLQLTTGPLGMVIPPHAQITVRTRQGGERIYWHGQTKTLKKLLQSWHVPPWQREQLYLIYVNDELAQIPGWATSDRYRTHNELGLWVRATAV